MVVGVSIAEVSESINTSPKSHFSASTKTGNRFINNHWVIENPIVIGVRIAVYFSTATHNGHVLLTSMVGAPKESSFLGGAEQNGRP
jgi:hypothetical protein